jgi:ECF sigma factor
MTEVSRILSDLARGDAHAAGQLLPLVYEELRKLAAARMAEEAPGNTLDATALVHQAYLRLVGPADAARWDNRGHFFAAAAEAMRRILVEAARRKRREKHGGDRQRIALDAAQPAATTSSPSMQPSLGWRPRIRKRRSSSNSATSPGFPSRRRHWPWESRRAPQTAFGRSPEPGCTENSWAPLPIQNRKK